MYSKEINCSVCEGLLHEWKAYHTDDGKHRICSTCYHAAIKVYKTDKGFNIQNYKKARSILEENYKNKNLFVSWIKKLGTYTKNQKVFKWLEKEEQEQSLKLFGKERHALLPEQENSLITQIWEDLEEEYTKEEQEEILKTEPTLFHADNKRYYKYV